jgi:hypothetical protein
MLDRFFRKYFCLLPFFVLSPAVGGSDDFSGGVKISDPGHLAVFVLYAHGTASKSTRFANCLQVCLVIRTLLIFVYLNVFLRMIVNTH